MRPERFDFSSWLQPKFPLTARHGSWGSTCGSAALAMIVDKEPFLLERQSGCNSGNPFDIPDMQRMLKRHGFESHWFEGPQGLVNTGLGSDWASDHLAANHLLLFTADMTKEDASWFVGYNGSIWHNGSVFSTSPMFGLTNPMIDLLLVRRKKTKLKLNKRKFMRR